MSEQKEVKLSDFHEQANWDRFYLTATPKLFEWLRWAATLAALQYVQKKTHSAAVHYVTGLAGLFLLMYFNAYFYQFNFTDLPFARTTMAKRLTSVVLSGLLGGAMWWLVTEAVDAIVQTQK